MPSDHIRGASLLPHEPRKRLHHDRRADHPPEGEQPVDEWIAESMSDRAWDADDDEENDDAAL